jgi:hypothetical protein
MVFVIADTLVSGWSSSLIGKRLDDSAVPVPRQWVCSSAVHFPNLVNACATKEDTE